MKSETVYLVASRPLGEAIQEVGVTIFEDRARANEVANGEAGVCLALSVVPLAAKPTYHEAVKAAAKARRQASKLLKPTLLAEAAKVFKKYKSLESFGWEQWTDHFNDGDTCYFSVRSDEPYLNGEQCFEPDTPEEKAVAKLVASFDQDDMLAVFGDHVKVFVTRGGKLKTEGYTNHS